jgi:hypothetical protein
MNNATATVKEAELSIVVIRANGTIEDLGVVARYAPNQTISATSDSNTNIKETILWHSEQEQF